MCARAAPVAFAVVGTRSTRRSRSRWIVDCSGARQTGVSHFGDVENDLASFDAGQQGGLVLDCDFSTDWHLIDVNIDCIASGVVSDASGSISGRDNNRPSD